MAVVVTGGKGGLGSELVAELRSRGAEVVPASRRTGFDLATGVGVADTLADADVIVHAATHLRFSPRRSERHPAVGSCWPTPVVART